jgi:putative FmdB family regulatory protein
MPTYEYECKTCTHTFEAVQSMSDDALKDCPECGKEIRRIIGGGMGIIFKGSGFYVTDNRGDSSGKKSGNGEGSNSTGSGASESKDKGAKTEAPKKPASDSSSGGKSKQEVKS